MGREIERMEFEIRIFKEYNKILDDEILFLRGKILEIEQIIFEIQMLYDDEIDDLREQLKDFSQ